MKKRIFALLLAMALVPAASVFAQTFENLPYAAYIPENHPQIAIIFYAGGMEVARHYIYDIVRNHDAIVYNDAIPLWLDYADFAPDQNAIALHTADGIRYVFDMATGEIIDAFGFETDLRPLNTFIALLGMGLFAAAIALVATKKQKQNRRNAVLSKGR